MLAGTDDRVAFPAPSAWPHPEPAASRRIEIDSRSLIRTQYT